MTDDLTRTARLFRAEAVAALVATLRSDKALPSAKNQAATKLLELSDGKPQQTKLVSLSDLDKLSQPERVALLYDLMQRCESETGILQSLMRDAVMQVAASHQTTPKFHFRRGDPLALPAPTTLTAQNSAVAAQKLEDRLPRHPNGRIRPSAHSRAAQPNSLDAELPPPRSPAHSPVDPTRPTHHANGRPIRRLGDGDPNADSADPSQDHWTRLLNGYNARWRNGHDS
jgi:hypothetical protein